MNEDFLEFNKALSEFIEQDDHETLVLIATGNDLVVPAKALEAMSRQSEDGVFLMGVFPFKTASQWMNSFAAMLQQQIETANAMLTKDALAPWPPLPVECMNPGLPAARRLRAAVEYCTEIMPESERPVWVLLPCECQDPAGYAGMVQPLCSAEPWLYGHRFIIWDDREKPLLVPELERTENEEVLAIELDFSTSDQLNKLVLIAQDRKRPVDMRMEALFQLAAVDYAYKRYPQAVEKYAALFDYYEGKDKTRQAMCLLGIGDVAMRSNQLVLALERYRSGLAIAAAEQSAPVLLLLLMAAGRACMKLEIYDEAEGYFDHANGVAGKLFNAYTKADALEQRGIAQQHQHRASEAIKSWQSCETLCQNFAYEERWKSVLQHQLKLYKYAKMKKQARDIKIRLNQGMPMSPKNGATDNAVRPFDNSCAVNGESVK